MEKTKSVLTSQDKQPQTDRHQMSLITQIVNEMWSEPRLADAFMKDRKGWQKDLASNLSVSSDDINRAVGTFGAKKFKDMVSNHPAGTSPANVAAQPVRRDYGRSMNTDAQYCQTGNSCGTCNSKCYTCIKSKPAHTL